MRDVVIVGAGPVGILLGCLLAGRGIDVEVLERRTEPSMRSRAIGIHPPSMRVLEQIGVADEVLARAVRIREGVVRCDRRTLGRLSFAGAAPRYPFVAALPQYETEALLRRRFDVLRPAGLRQGVSVTGLRDLGDHVELTAGDGERIQARYVVAADGARSLIRQAAGIGWAARGRSETYLMGDFPDHGEHGTTAVLFFERGGVVESFPLPNGRRRWVAMTERLVTDASRADLAALIRSRTGVGLPVPAGAASASLGGPSSGLPGGWPGGWPGDSPGDLPNAVPAGWTTAPPTGPPVGSPLGPPSAFAARQHLAGRMSVGRVALVGDAAHEISPIGGQGMNLGWLDCLALAPALERALAEPAAAASVLAGFDRRRRRAARMAARQAGFNMAMGRPAGGIRLRARNALVRVLAVPPARGLLARAFTMRWL
jgi:2-polyprenyl-6-methoxyphenol hydroxylase-like FAD-dependent oxidoreductase